MKKRLNASARVLAARFTSLTLFASMGVASAATITVNSVADDVFMNAAGQTFSDPALAVPVAPAYCTLRMAIAAANGNIAVGGCTAGSGADTIVFTAPANSGTIVLSQVTMSEAPAVYGTSPPNWLLAISSPVTITGPGSAALTISGGGFSPGSVGRRSLLITDGSTATDTPVSISGLRFKEGRAVPTPSASNPTVAVGSSGGCVFSRESLTLTDVIFENCETSGYGDANVNTGAVGGALGMGAALASDARPNATLTNVKFIGNRTVHGSANSVSTSAAGAAALGNTTNLWMGSVSITDSEFSGNSSEAIGALRVQNASSVSIVNSRFFSNAATAFNDGAFNISNISGTVTVSDTFAVGNSAQMRRGGGQISTVGASLTPSDEVVTISNGGFAGNLAKTQDIGGLSILTDIFDASGNCTFGQLRSVRMTNVTFERNFAAASRGGFRIGCSGNVALTGIDMLGNRVFGLSTAGSGGNSAGIIHDVAALTMDMIRIVGNETATGAVDGGSGVFAVNGSPFASPALTYPLTHSFTGSRFVVKDNSAQESQGGVTLQANGAGRNYSLSDSSFVGNSAKGFVGLFLQATGNYTVSNSTFSGNTSLAGGSAPISVNTHSSSGTNLITLRGITSVRNNQNTHPIVVNAFNPAGGTTTANAAVVIKNSILGQYQYGNGFSGVIPTLAGVSYSISNSVIESYAAGSMPAGICGVAGVICNVDAKLEGIADNGGSPLQNYTHALRAGSPALDTGDSTGAPLFDQRGTGFPRIVNGTIDIGAFESAALTTSLPCKLDMDGDNLIMANKEGLVLVRAMLGFSGAAVVSGTGISQGQWDTARNNLNANCGTNFSP